MEEKLTTSELAVYLAEVFPQSTVEVEASGAGFARVRQAVGDAELRPGGTVSGPVMMATADTATYAALLASIGRTPLAVTTNLTIHFMRKPTADRDVVAEARLLKLGRQLAVAEVRITSEGSEALVAHATVTYSIPPQPA
ncbi:MAG: PaaI family thioesterase [Deltaproteobacteria bacterium]|nr:PaaI family thioesterase [Deltaproteobacteria bacterium]MBW2448474.1 PaaI family thioesterase [Deltaproteobacteria bacterium]